MSELWPLKVRHVSYSSVSSIKDERVLFRWCVFVFVLRILSFLTGKNNFFLHVMSHYYSYPINFEKSCDLLNSFSNVWNLPRRNSKAFPLVHLKPDSFDSVSSLSLFTFWKREALIWIHQPYTQIPLTSWEPPTHVLLKFYFGLPKMSWENCKCGPKIVTVRVAVVYHMRTASSSSSQVQSIMALCERRLLT